MVNIPREGLGLLLKLAHAIQKSETATEAPEGPEAEALRSGDLEAEPMKAYWETDKDDLSAKNQPYIDLFFKDVSLGRIPDATEKPLAESRYNFESLSLSYLPDALRNLNVGGKVL